MLVTDIIVQVEDAVEHCVQSLLLLLLPHLHLLLRLSVARGPLSTTLHPKSLQHLLAALHLLLSHLLLLLSPVAQLERLAALQRLLLQLLRLPRRAPGEWWKVQPAPQPAQDDPEDEDEFEDAPDVPAPSETDEDEVMREVTPAGDSDGEQLAGYTVVEFAGSAEEPRSYLQAVNGPNGLHWKRAAEEEINTLVANGTWEIVDRPPDVKPLRSGWVFKVKMNPDGSIERYKGRLVAKGCSQRPGVDFNEVFAPTFRPAALRLILALAAAEDLHLRSIDISSAFTYGDLEEDIYMHQPEGFQEGGPNKVLKLITRDCSKRHLALPAPVCAGHAGEVWLG